MRFSFVSSVETNFPCRPIARANCFYVVAGVRFRMANVITKYNLVGCRFESRICIHECVNDYYVSMGAKTRLRNGVRLSSSPARGDLTSRARNVIATGKRVFVRVCRRLLSVRRHTRVGVRVHTLCDTFFDFSSGWASTYSFRANERFSYFFTPARNVIRA